MSTFHAVVWMDHNAQAQRIHSRSHHKHQGKAGDAAAFFSDVAKALTGTHEVLLAGPGLARNEFRDWCNAHQAATAKVIVDSIATDHPTDNQLVALAKQYFKKFDAMSSDPALQ